MIGGDPLKEDQFNRERKTIVLRKFDSHERCGRYWKCSETEARERTFGRKGVSPQGKTTATRQRTNLPSVFSARVSLVRPSLFPPPVLADFGPAVFFAYGHVTR